MRAVVQRVTESHVTVNGSEVGRIGLGLMVLLGVAKGDTEKTVDWMIEKIVHLRVFDDDDGKMNRSLMDVGGCLLLVSQFTLIGDCRKGRRPSYVNAARPDAANALYEYAVEQARIKGVQVETGVFQAMMQVSLVNDGPVTLVIDSPYV